MGNVFLPPVCCVSLTRISVGFMCPLSIVLRAERSKPARINQSSLARELMHVGDLHSAHRHTYLRNQVMHPEGLERLHARSGMISSSGILRHF